MKTRLLALCMFFISACNGRDWRTADRSSAGIAPTPESEPEAIVQIYAARALNWRGWFAVHTWVATKEKNADHYTVYQVIGWRMYRGLSVVAIAPGIPDGRWFGAEPELLAALKGEKAEAAIPNIEAAAASYPYPNTYRVWPGPNSNSFVSYIIRHTPELRIDLPPHAIGKDWIDRAAVFARTESKTGFQISILGVLGIAVGMREGIEINIIGLNFGIDFLHPALKLPIVGRIGVKPSKV